MKKYELLQDDFTEFDGTKLYRIKALIGFRNVSAGDLGGYVESENNLSQSGCCWIYDNTKVYGGARVCDDALVCGKALVGDNALASGSAIVRGNARVYGKAKVCGNAIVNNGILIFGKSE